MSEHADRAVELAEKEAAKAGLSTDQAKRLVDPALRKCAAIASEIVGRTVPPDMDAIMALGDDVMRQIQTRLMAEADQKDARRQQAKPATSFERARPRNKFV